jgi:hypothetical protein
MRGEVASEGEREFRNAPAVSLQRLRDQLEEVQSLRERGFDDRADRLFERILLALNAMDHAKLPTTDTVSEALSHYEPRSSSRVLFIGSPSSEYEDDIQLLQRRLSDLALMADCVSVDFLLQANQFDCIIFDLESCGPHVASRIKELRSGSQSCPRVFCISQYAPSLYGLSLEQPVFDGWLWKPWDYEMIWKHFQMAFGYVPQETR